MTTTNQLPPHDTEAEQAVLGCVLLAPDDCLPDLHEATAGHTEAFYDVRHQSLSEAFFAMQAAGEKIDLITLPSWLRARGTLEACGGRGYVSNLPDMVASPVMMGTYLRTVTDLWTQRRIIQGSHKVLAHAHGSDPAATQAAVADLVSAAEVVGIEREAPATGSELALETTTALQRLYDLQGAIPGLETPWRNFNSSCGGLMWGEFSVIGARPSVGKTAFALNLAEHAAFDLKIPTLVISMEMNRDKLMLRIFARRKRVPMGVIRHGHFTEEDFAKIGAFQTEVLAAPLHVAKLSSGVDVRKVVALIHRSIRKAGIRLVVIDYLQRISSRGHDKKNYEVGDVSSALANCIHETGIACCCLAQLSRDADADESRLPRMKDLADSSQIERDADLIGLLHRPETAKNPSGNEATLVIAKARDAEKGLICFNFEGQFQEFTAKTERLDVGNLPK